MNDLSEATTSSGGRHRLIAACGVTILALSAGAALLPAIDHDAGADVVGGLLLGAGLIETCAGTLHWRAKGLSAISGAVTAAAGLLFAFNRDIHFMGTAAVVTAWLLLRSVILLAAGLQSAGSVRAWTIASALMDIFLAVLLLAGLSMSMLTVALFGPTSQLVGSFAWIFALSFVVTGAMLIEIASCQARADG